MYERIGTLLFYFIIHNNLFYIGRRNITVFTRVEGGSSWVGIRDEVVNACF
jgi:hypothetical protein